MRNKLLKKYGAWYEQGAWRFPSVWSKEQFEKEYNEWLKERAAN